MRQRPSDSDGESEGIKRKKERHVGDLNLDASGDQWATEVLHLALPGIAASNKGDRVVREG